MIYADVFTASANGDMAPRLFEESITVAEVSITGAAAGTATVKIYHSINGRTYRQIATMTMDQATGSSDLHVTLWPPGWYYASVANLPSGGKISISFAGE